MSDTQKQRVQKIAGVKGMNDLLPGDAPLWEHFDNAVRSMLRAYGYQQIRTPIVEHTQLFVRGIGEVTDIVEKEMYSFTDSLNGEHLTLRPEGTAAAVRAVIEHNLLYDGPKRLWYTGPMFRHERPQRGRYRQFHQVGVEALGFAGPDIDAEVILMCQRLWDDLGLVGLKLELNSLGQAEERAAHRADLIKYLEGFQDILDEDGKRRLYTNPLRVLDTKNPALQEMAAGAPKLIDYLGEVSLKHFEGVQALLKANNIPYTINPRLVRGLDYYNLTVFEWTTDKLGAQGTVAGGGRYDPLIEQIGGKPAPALRLGDGRGAHHRTAARREAGTGAAGLRCLYRPPGRPGPGAGAGGGRTAARRRPRCDPPLLARRPQRQLQVAVQARRRERGILCGYHWRRRSRGRCGPDQAAARRTECGHPADRAVRPTGRPADRRHGGK